MEKENSKEKKKKRLLLIILLLALLIFLLIIFFYFYLNKEENSSLQTSLHQMKIVSDERKRNNHQSDEVTLQGFGTLNINKDYPYIYLKNLDNNNVYLKYNVYFADESMYETGLIEPGMMERYAIYDVLNMSGEYELTYYISLYDLKTKDKLPSIYKMKQSINIE